jgi:hypothetical protein
MSYAGPGEEPGGDLVPGRPYSKKENERALRRAQIVILLVISGPVILWGILWWALDYLVLGIR